MVKYKWNDFVNKNATGGVNYYCTNCFDKSTMFSSQQTVLPNPAYYNNDFSENVDFLKHQSTPDLRSNHSTCPGPFAAGNKYWGYTYEYGQNHLSSYFGHHTCSTYGSQLVPKHMGWLWNVKPPGVKKLPHKLNPGSIAKPVKELMQNFLADYPLDTIPNTRLRASRLARYKKFAHLADDIPMFKVQRKSGEYFITMRPMKKRTTLAENMRPYLNCSPIFLKLTKRPDLKASESAARKDAASAVQKGSGNIKGALEVAHADDKQKCALVSEGTESDLSLEFTPPLPKLDPRMFADRVEASTQYNCTDFVQKFPTKAEKSKKSMQSQKKAAKGKAAAPKKK